MKIILSGGGTLGPVTPLIAIANTYKRKHPFVEFLWVGTKHGPERILVEKEGFKFIAISSGKLRRYFSILNFIDIFRIISAYWQCRYLLKKEKPDLLITAGGFVSVPLHLAAKALRIPTWVHQQDAIAGLANKLMSKSANLVTVALEISLKYFNRKKTRWIGNPVRNLNGRDKILSCEKFNIRDNEPVVFVVGGGTGASRLNSMINEALSFLPKEWHVIHLVGLNHSKNKYLELQKVYPNYFVYDFFVEEMADAYAVADIVVARGGFGTLTELAALSKAAVLIPISSSHQEVNVSFFADKNAVIKIDEINDSGARLAEVIKELAHKSDKRNTMSETLHDLLPTPSDDTICNIIDELVTK